VTRATRVTRAARAALRAFRPRAIAPPARRSIPSAFACLVAAKSGKIFMLQASEELFEQVSESDKASFAPSNERDAALAGFLAAVVGKIVLAKGGIKKEEFWALLVSNQPFL